MNAGNVEAGLFIEEGHPLAIAYEICERESRSVNVKGLIVDWKPSDPSAFAVPIELKDVVLNRPLSSGLVDISRATFFIGGEEETDIVIDDKNIKDIANDGFVELILGRFGEIYNTHEHSMCLRALRLQRMKEVERARIKRKQSEIARSQFNINDKRHSAQA